MVIKQNGKFKVIKDGSSFYRVMCGKKRIGSFLMLPDAVNYMNQRAEAGK